MWNLWFSWKKAVRTITRDKKKSFSLIFILSIIIGLGALFDDMFYCRARNFSHYTSQSDMADILILIEPSKMDTIEQSLNSNMNELISQFESRLVLTTTFSFDNNFSTQGILIGVNLSRSSHLNSLVLPNRTSHIIPNNTLGYSFWGAHQDIELGSTLKISYASKQMEFPIEFTGYNPEWYYYPISTIGIGMSFENPPVFYHDLGDFCDKLNIPVIANQILLRLQPNTDVETFKQNITDHLHNQKIIVLDILSFEEFPSISLQLTEIKNSEGLAPVLIGFFYIFGVIILLVIIHRLIENDTAQIGVLQSLGIYEGEMHLTYFFYTIIILLSSLSIGLVFRLLIGVKILEQLMQNVGVPYISEFPWIPEVTIQIILLILGLVILLNSLLIHRTMKFLSTENIKAETDKLQHKTVIERLLRKFHKRPFHPFTHYSLRRALSRKGLFVTTIGVIIIAQMGMYFGLGIFDLWSEIIDYKYQKIERWDGYALTWQMTNNSGLKNTIGTNPGVEISEEGLIYKTKIVLPNQNRPVTLLAFQNDSILHHHEIRKGQNLSKGGDILISEDLVDGLGLKISDKVQLETSQSAQISQIDSSVVLYNFTVVGISADVQSETIFISLEDAESILGVDHPINVIYFRQIPNQSPDAKNQTYQSIETTSKVAQVILKEDSLGQMERLIENFAGSDSAIGVGIIFLCLSAIFIIMKSMLDLRIEDYLNFKVMGMYNSEIWRFVLKEIGLDLFIAVPIGKLIGDYFVIWISVLLRDFIPGVTIQLSLLVQIIVPLITIGLSVFGALMALVSLRIRDVEAITRKKNFG